MKTVDFESLQERLDRDLSEDEIIVSIMKVYPELYDILEFNEFTLKERLEKNAYLQEQFRFLCIKEKSKLKKLEIQRDEYIGKLYDELKYEDNRSLTKTEIERYYILKDPEYIKLTRLYNIQTVIVETFETIKEALKSQSYNMRTFLETLKL